MKKKLIVSESEAGMRLQTFLHHHIGGSNRALKRAIENNGCTVNGRIERHASTLLAIGNIITLEIVDESVSHSFANNQILFEDSTLLIYNKPAGIVCDESGIIPLVHTYYPKAILVHRLDRDTTGALIFAKNKIIFNQMIDLFREFKINKTYLAWVDGVPRQSKGIIENFLGIIRKYQGQAIWGPVSEGGSFASTSWQCQRKGHDTALIKCHPKTGRTHQLRVHLAGLGHPILGDYQYGRCFQSSLRPQRCLLHASELSFPHPISGILVHVIAPTPDDFFHSGLDTT